MTVCATDPDLVRFLLAGAGEEDGGCTAGCDHSPAWSWRPLDAVLAWLRPAKPASRIG